jgi:hypothetical protein
VLEKLISCLQIKLFNKVGRRVSRGLTLPDQETEHLGQELKAPPLS